jgi:gamma-glutamyltranspeptidase/glutathione hydrolase
MVLNIVDFQMPIARAVAAPRIHHQWLPDNVRIEQGGITPSAADELRAMGYQVTVGGSQGRVHAIMIDPRTGMRIGAADPRDPDAGARGH